MSSTAVADEPRYAPGMKMPDHEYGTYLDLKGGKFFLNGKCSIDLRLYNDDLTDRPRFRTAHFSAFTLSHLE